MTAYKNMLGCDYRRVLFTISCMSHYNDVPMSVTASRITSLTIDYSSVYSKRRSKLTPKLSVTGFVRGIHLWPVNSPHKGPVTRKMFSFDGVIMIRCAIKVTLESTEIVELIGCPKLRPVTWNHSTLSLDFWVDKYLSAAENVASMQMYLPNLYVWLLLTLNTCIKLRIM